MKYITMILLGIPTMICIVVIATISGILDLINKFRGGKDID